MDEGTHQLLHCAGFPFADAVRDGVFRGCPLVKSGAEFLSPAYYNDVLELASVVERFGTKSVQVRHRFYRAETELAHGHEVRVWAMRDDADPRVR